jgi:hypothetical protein
MKASERRWLRDADAAIGFDDAALSELFPEETLVRARQAFRLLAQTS